jgi:hypothetical protein
MRVVLLLLVAGLSFLLTLTLAQAILLSTAATWLFIPLWGGLSAQHTTPAFTVKDGLAYVLAAKMTGTTIYAFSRLLYRRSA